MKTIQDTPIVCFAFAFICCYCHLANKDVYIYSYNGRRIQGDHLSGKPANVMEFDSCQGNVRDFTKS